MNKIKSLVYRNHIYIWSTEENGRIVKYMAEVKKPGIYRMHNKEKRLIKSSEKIVLYGRKMSSDIKRIMKFMQPCVLATDFNQNI